MLACMSEYSQADGRWCISILIAFTRWTPRIKFWGFVVSYVQLIVYQWILLVVHSKHPTRQHMVQYIILYVWLLQLLFPLLLKIHADHYVTIKNSNLFKCCYIIVDNDVDKTHAHTCTLALLAIPKYISMVPMCPT